MSACTRIIGVRTLLPLAVGWVALVGAASAQSPSPAYTAHADQVAVEPLEGAPSADVPAADAPSTDAPAAEAPAAEASAVDAPAVDAPAAGAAVNAPAAPDGRRRVTVADPWEGLNRKVFLFNGVLDHFVIQPLAEAYEYAMPRPARLGIDNFIGNIGDMWSTVNLLLQGKPARAVEMTLRVGVNTVLGLGGLLDVAAEMGMERQSEDFGQTLAVWGVPTGGYLVVPIFGPSTVRDAAAMPLDRSFRNQFSPSGESQRWRWVGVQAVHARADVLPFTRMLDTVALDKYVYVRDAFLTRRRSLVHDGDPPPLQDDEPDTAPEPAKAPKTSR